MEGAGRYSLQELKDLVVEYRSGNGEALWFSARSRSLDCVVRVLSCTEVAAECTILDGLVRLKDSDFCRSRLQWDDVVDEYGLENYCGQNWYIKFMICQDDTKSIEQISFHPLEKDMILANGKILRAKRSKGDRNGSQ